MRRYRYQIAKSELPGSWPSVAFGAVDPFIPAGQYAEANLSPSVVGVNDGIGQGHHVATDNNFYCQLAVERDVPLSPLFCRDLAGRVIYLGPGPEIKGNDEWEAYRLPEGTPPEEQNMLIPFVVFPRHCRDVPLDSEQVPDVRLLEEVMLCHFRCLEQPSNTRYWPSGAAPEDDMEAMPYFGANLYPYKLRPDTFYPDGYRLPQTQMVFARGVAQGADPTYAYALGESVLKAWETREESMDYATWFEALGDVQIDELFAKGCTLIPTFEAFNGCAVVGREFELQEYWPGRAVAGLHDVVEMRPDSAPIGTILEVLRPGFVTAQRVVLAQVVVSDGSGYVSPNAADPEPMVPNLNLPHSRSVPNWRACHLPTHPLHFESPALWGYEPESGKFLQILGPLWAPLYYVYGCTDYIIDAYDFPEIHPESPRHVRVPEALKGRFWPIVPLMGFDTFDTEAMSARREQSSKLRTMIVREPTEEPQAGIAYHPMPIEFEFECEPFWFPILHPLHRGHGLVPEDLMERIAPVISPKLFPEAYIESIKGNTILCPWLKSVGELSAPDDDVIGNYPGLMRYLLPNLDFEAIMRWAPDPVLGNMEDLLRLPASRWWNDSDDEDAQAPDNHYDIAAWAGPESGAIHAAIWDMREACVTLTKFRHTLFQINPELYTLGYWYGATPEALQAMFLEEIANAEEADARLNGLINGEDEPAATLAPTANATPMMNIAEDELSPAEQAQLRALQNMATARERNRLLDNPATEAKPNPLGVKGE